MTDHVHQLGDDGQQDHHDRHPCHDEGTADDEIRDRVVTQSIGERAADPGELPVRR
jgi:hypothetical protein